MSHSIHIEQSCERPIVVVRRRASIPQLSKVVPEACGAVWKEVRTHSLSGAGRNVALYLDDEINLEVGVEMDHPLPAESGLIRSALPAGTVASTVHLGPYPKLHLAHEAVRAWCARHGHVFAGPNWEIYGHWQEAWNADPSQITTEVCYLLKTA